MAAIDLFSNLKAGLDSPIENSADVTPNDGVDLTNATRALYVSVGGDIKVTMVGGQTVTFTAVAVGLFPVRVVRVWSTGTTATGIKGLW